MSLTSPKSTVYIVSMSKFLVLERLALYCDLGSDNIDDILVVQGAERIAEALKRNKSISTIDLVGVIRTIIYCY